MKYEFLSIFNTSKLSPSIIIFLESSKLFDNSLSGIKVLKELELALQRELVFPDQFSP